MAGEQELTPEEKLLMVIQKGESPLGADANRTDELTFGDESDATPVSHSTGSTISLGLINKILAVVVLIGLGLVGYEIYRNQPAPETKYPPEELSLLDNGEKLVIASLSDTLDMFDTRRIFGKPPARWKDKEDPLKPPVMTGWRAYARDNLVFKGRSTVNVPQDDGTTKQVLEAIVMDKKENKMHFLRVDSKIHLLDKDVRVEKIDGNRLTFTYGKESLTIGESTNRKIIH